MKIKATQGLLKSLKPWPLTQWSEGTCRKGGSEVPEMTVRASIK